MTESMKHALDGAVTGAKDVMTGKAGASKKDAQLATFTQEYNGEKKRTNYGVGISNTDFWLRVVDEKNGRVGPSLLEDSIGREKIHHFDHERIPERVVHARGVGAHGYFKLYESCEDVTSAHVFTNTSHTTPVFVRFSTVAGSRGSADTVRDVRGFAVKMYTEEGNFDIVGNDIPVFFIQDAMKFPDLIHAAKPEPDKEIPQAQTAHNNFWDFAYMHSEATHTLMWAMSDRGIPRSLRMIQGFGVNTYCFINKAGERSFVKFHYTPELGVHSLVWDEALKICGQDPDFHRRDLYGAIEAGAFPKWKFGFQIIKEADEHNFEFDILDATKVWPEELVPVRYVGELVLNRNVDEYFPETEQVAFCTSHMPPGVTFSNDPLLQGRNFSYFDTQISRLGGMNFEELPINRPLKPVSNDNRDGMRRMKITKGKINYWPNRFEANPPMPPSEGGYVDYKEEVHGWKQRLLAPKFKDHLSQAQMYVNSLAPHEFAHLVSAISFELSHCEEPLVFDRWCEDRLADIHPELAKQVAAAASGKTPKTPEKVNPGHKSAALSQTYFAPEKPTIATRKIAFLLADGFDKGQYMGISSALAAMGAWPMPIGTRRGPVYAAGETPGKDEGVMTVTSLEGFRSTLVDALVIVGGPDHILKLREQGRAIHWVREAFGHLKAIGAVGEGVDLLQHVVVPGVDLALTTSSDQVVESYGVVTARALPTGNVIKDAVNLVKGATDFISNFAFQVSQHRCWARETDGLSSKVAY